MRAERNDARRAIIVCGDVQQRAGASASLEEVAGLDEQPYSGCRYERRRRDLLLDERKRRRFDEPSLP